MEELKEQFACAELWRREGRPYLVIWRLSRTESTEPMTVEKFVQWIHEKANS